MTSFLLDQLARVAKFGEAEALKHYIRNQEFTHMDIDNFITILSGKPQMLMEIMCKAARMGYMAPLDTADISIGDIMRYMKFEECRWVNKLPSRIKGDITKKDLSATWPAYDRYVMERFATLRFLGYIPHVAYQINEWMGL